MSPVDPLLTAATGCFATREFALEIGRARVCTHIWAILSVMSAEQLEWRDQVLAYAAKINAFAARGLSSGGAKAGPQPPEPKLDHLMGSAVEAIRDANRRGTWSTLREGWPPAHGPLIPWLEKHGQSIPVVHFLDDGTAVARIGAQYAGGRTVHIRGDSVVELPTVGFFGRAKTVIRRHWDYRRTF